MKRPIIGEVKAVGVKEELKSKITSVNQWRWLCFLPGIICMTAGRHAIDAEHARNSGIFPLVGLSVGLIVFCVLQVLKSGWKRRLKALEQQSSATPGPPVQRRF